MTPTSWPPQAGPRLAAFHGARGWLLGPWWCFFGGFACACVVVLVVNASAGCVSIEQSSASDLHQLQQEQAGQGGPGWGNRSWVPEELQGFSCHTACHAACMHAHHGCMGIDNCMA